MSLDPATIAAFVDGELDDLTARRISREAMADAALAAEITRHRALKERLAAHYAPIAEEAVPERLRSLLATDEGVDDVDGVDEGVDGVDDGDDKVDTSLADRRNAKPARFRALQWSAIAASLLLGLTIGVRPWMPAADVTIRGSTLIAAGSLADALDTQLASNQSSDAAVRIGLSFEDKAGRYCRSFESSVIAGIGCREGHHWQLERTMGGTPSNDYRQASSAELAAAAVAMMKRDALDAEAERAARDAGWTSRP